MKLGDVVQIVIGTPDVAESAEFYDKLGFETLAAGEEPWPWRQVTDGQHLLLLNQDGNRYIGLNYFSPQAAEIAAAVAAAGVSFLRRDVVDGRLQIAIFSDSDGLMVGLVDQETSYMTLPEGAPITRCGKFGEFALGVADMLTAVAFWQRFGFAQLYASSEPYPWAILGDGLMVLGLHQTDEFAGPCLTYFAADMPARIAALQEMGLTIENGVLVGPAGETFFLFEGEI